MNKLLDNLGIQAIRTLGIKQFCTVYWNFLVTLPSILKNKNLVALDKKMSSCSSLNIYHKFGSFKVNLKNIDSQIVEQGSYAFSSVRELYIKNCYFRFHPNIKFQEIQVVVDLGGNRGMFSTLCSSFCKKLVIVEVQKIYNKVIKENLLYNGFKNFIIFNKFIGTEGKFKSPEINEVEFISFQDLLSLAKIDKIDFLKVDIEGSEFTLFAEALPFNKIRYISMEIHREYGNVGTIISKLKENNFSVLTSDSEFKQTDNVKKIDYLFAQNLNFTIQK